MKDKKESQNENDSIYGVSKNDQTAASDQIRKGCCFKLMGRIPKSWVIPYKNQYRKMWDLVPISLSIYNSFIIPFELSFGPVIIHQKLNFAIELIIDLIFFFDVLLMFFSSFQDKRGFEQKDPYQIYHHYTRSFRFLLDSVSLLGSQVFLLVSKVFRNFMLLKALRIYRIGEMISKSQSRKKVKVSMKIS